MNNYFDDAHDLNENWAALAFAIISPRARSPEECFSKLYTMNSAAIMREILRLRAEGYSLSETATALGMTKHAVQKRLKRYEAARAD